jgi:hypothetical protein
MSVSASRLNSGHWSTRFRSPWDGKPTLMKAVLNKLNL